MINGAKLAEILKEVQENEKAGILSVTSHKRREKKKRGIKKMGPELGKYVPVVVPLELAFPFNPMTGDRTQFNSSNPFTFPSEDTSVYAGIRMIKEAIKDNQQMIDFYGSLGGFKAGEYELVQDEITEQDKHIFRQYTRIQIFTNDVQTWKLPGLSSSPWGVKRLSRVKTNDYGMVVGQVDIGYQAYKFFESMYFQEKEQIDDDYKTGVRKGSYDDKRKDYRAAREKMGVTNPYPVSVALVLQIPTDSKTKTLASEDVAELKGGNLRKYLKYMAVSEDRLTELTELISDSDNTNLNYLEVVFAYKAYSEEPDENERKKKAAKDTKPAMIENEKRTIKAQVENFDVVYDTFRCDEKIYTNDIVMNSVYDFRDIDDSVAKTALKTYIEKNKSKITTNIAESHTDFLMLVDDALTEDVLLEGDEGTDVAQLETKFFDEKELTTAKDEGMGISEVDDIEIDSESIDDLLVEE